MSPNSSAPEVPGRRKVVRIRPAVPLIYERQLAAGTAHSPSCKTTSEHENGKSVKDYEISHTAQSSMRDSADHFEGKIIDERLPQPQNGSIEHLEPETGVLEHATQETEQLFEACRVLPDERGEGANQKADERAEPFSKNLDEESVTVSMSPQSSIQSISEATNTMDPPETYPVPDGQFPGSPDNIAPQPKFPDRWALPPHALQDQSHFIYGCINGNQVNSIGGLPPPTPSASVDDGNSPFDPKFVDHILSSFNDSRYADMRLIVAHENSRFEEKTFFLHKILVSRSETIRRLIDMSTKNHDVGKMLDVRISLCDRLITPMALDSALRTCYGQATSTFLTLKCQDRSDTRRNQSVVDMQNVLAFAAAGNLFKLEEVVLQALEKLKKVLDWENLQHALSFGLESCIHRRRSAEASLLQSFVYSMSDGELFSVDCAQYLLDLSLSFMAVYFPDNWDFDKTAEALPIVDRLPATGKISITQNRKPKLLSIQFGQRPPEVAHKLMNRDALISSILLSIPTEQLQLIVLSKIPNLIRQLPQIVEEREHRRLAAFNSEVSWDQRLLSRETEWYWVGFRESLASTGLHDETIDLSCSPVPIYRTTADEREARKRDQASQGQIQSRDAYDS